MKKLLNSLYITNEKAYLALDGENIVCYLDDNEKFRIPFSNVESIFCFSYLGCSPALMGKCAKNMIPINFISPSGRFLGKIIGETKGNVFLRVKQIEMFKGGNLTLAQNTVAAKITNSVSLIKRSMHDNSNLRTNDKIIELIEYLKKSVDKAFCAENNDELLGVEGNAAHRYFDVFNMLITQQKNDFILNGRTKRPPLDKVNAVLSFLYTVYTLDYAAALESVGLDSYVGYYHSMRSGRSSLACDLVEETRCIVDRMVLSLINLKSLSSKDFETEISGAVRLTGDGRKKVITKWQEKKRTDIVHPYLNQKVQLGLLPYLQCSLLAKFIRGDIPEYPCYIQK